MRLLALVWAESTLPHIKDICQIEMIARAAKKILRKQLAEVIHYNSDEINKRKKDNLFHANGSNHNQDASNKCIYCLS